MRPAPMCLRCSTCGVNWPRTADFCKCPEHETDTSVITGTPLPLDEALSLKKHFEFERFFEKWDRERWQRQEQEIASLAA